MDDTENISLKACTTTGVRKHRSHLAWLTVALHEIPYVLEDSWPVTYPQGSYRCSSDEIFKGRNGRLVHPTLCVTVEEVHALSNPCCSRTF
ncbi:hypothetical protein TNCV_1780701 [Trichonephila clavipes]|nr:hypothetical protein TNCV_1780701 [Trichonephila clavipes]